ncbi:type II CRISPR-associated endonuclease Cas1 [Weeksellaceae bacterium KMM 9713]|uniref:CRISPR-associated endonuclease Cas1 n=1 Tax=Profundicola chukchiensis TaxID=2961959 RepID=A0A9X4MZR5_9FLAO|nr:type II CRISPR-associated endonuclease Cas1 [Profundicola chukchiensis]MDG4945875.1 type II CRISPR-associated endonuclease Cas1 [Profundicola chukchiensis]
MIKRTLFFGNPVYLSTQHRQMHLQFPDKERDEVNVPIEDIGIIVLESPQITITSGLLTKLIENKVVMIQCNSQHLPIGIMHPMSGHTLYTERLRYQLEASEPLKKNLWKQTVQAKIANQAKHLKISKKKYKKLEYWLKEVKSGDGENHEAYAAAYYFQHIFDLPYFSRNQKGIPPNHWLNYGYAILRAIAARAIVGSGLLPAYGIWHRNKYNAFCLADDIMEPYRPFVDLVVQDMLKKFELSEDLCIQHKADLLKIPAMDVEMDGKRSPLLNAMSRTSNSLFECLEGSSRKILYPQMI